MKSRLFAAPRRRLGTLLRHFVPPVARTSRGAALEPLESRVLLSAATVASVSSLGTLGNDYSYAPALSADGRWVAYESDATNLVAGDTNSQTDIFLLDRQFQVTTRISLASDGTQANGASGYIAISADGRYVAFVSSATNLVAGDTNGVDDVFLHDNQTGVTTRISLASDGTQADAASGHPAISADGRYVAFLSSATNLVPGDTNAVDDVFVYDTQTGTITRASVSSAGTQANDASSALALSGDGRFVAFQSSATNLVSTDTNGVDDIFLRDLQSGTTTRLSVSSAGVQANNPSASPTISNDGRFVAFSSAASNLVAGDTNAADDIFLRDAQSGQTLRLSTATGGQQANGVSAFPDISADGRFVTYESVANNLVADDTNGTSDIFVYDRLARLTCRVSTDNSGQQRTDVSFYPSISNDGRYVAFSASSDALLSGEPGGRADVYLSDSGVLTLTSPAGGQSFTVNSAVTVTWTSEGLVGTVRIELSTDGGLTWMTLADNTPDDGSQLVTIPARFGRHGLMRVSALSGTAAGLSAAEFLTGQPIGPDANGDGRGDLITLNRLGQWTVSTGQNGDQVWATWSSAVTWVDPLVGDLNGDGKADVLARAYGQWWAGISTGASFTTTFFGAWSNAVVWNDVRLADINGDGRMDVVGRLSTGQWWGAFSTGTSFVSQYMATWTPALTWTTLKPADVDGDGRDDLIGRGSNGQWWALCYNANTFSLKYLGAWSTAVTWVDLQVTDVNGDGLADVIGRANGTWWAGISNGTTFATRTMATWSTAVPWYDVRVADLNGDGLADVLARTIDGSWWAGISNGTTFTTIRMGAWASTVAWTDVRIIDLDGDGKQDLIGRIPYGAYFASLSTGSSFNTVLWTMGTLR